MVKHCASDESTPIILRTCDVPFEGSSRGRIGWLLSTSWVGYKTISLSSFFDCFAFGLLRAAPSQYLLERAAFHGTVKCCQPPPPFGRLRSSSVIFVILLFGLRLAWAGRVGRLAQADLILWWEFRKNIPRAPIIWYSKPIL